METFAFRGFEKLECAKAWKGANGGEIITKYDEKGNKSSTYDDYMLTCLNEEKYPYAVKWKL